MILILGLVFCTSAVAFAQPRPAETAKGSPAQQAAAPSTVLAKYEGGLFGYNEREMGTLKFDDENERLVFLGKNQKEKFGIPYKSLLVISPQSRSVTSTTGNVIRHIPLPGAGLAGLMRKKNRYLVVQFDDPDVDAKGILNFKLDNKALLDQVIQALGQKANLTKRGDAYYRPRTVKTEI